MLCAGGFSEKIKKGAVAISPPHPQPAEGHTLKKIVKSVIKIVGRGSGRRAVRGGFRPSSRPIGDGVQALFDGVGRKIRLLKKILLKD